MTSTITVDGQKQKLKPLPPMLSLGEVTADSSGWSSSEKNSDNYMILLRMSSSFFSTCTNQYVGMFTNDRQIDGFRIKTRPGPGTSS